MDEEERLTSVSKPLGAGNAGRSIAVGAVRDTTDADLSKPSPDGCIPPDSTDLPQSAAAVTAGLTLHSADPSSQQSAKEETVRCTTGATHTAFEALESSSQQSVETPSDIAREGHAGEQNPTPVDGIH